MHLIDNSTIIRVHSNNCTNNLDYTPIMTTLIQTYQRLLDELKPTYYRQFYQSFVLDNRFAGVVGARGVGKTTFLLQYLREQYGTTEKGLYISADHLYFSDHTLLDTAESFVKYHDGELLCIDEVHKYKNWNQELKNIYDSFPRLKVIFSGSSSIDLIKGKYDLSRRVILHHMHGFSFREYLEIQTSRAYPALTLEQVLSPNFKIPTIIKQTNKLLGHLHDYWQKGYYPTAQTLPTQSVYYQTIVNGIDKTIYEDITSFYALKTKNLDALKKLVYFFATSEPGSLSINRLASTIGKDHATISEYIQILRDTGLLRFLLNDKYGHALVRNAEKIYLNNTNLLYAVNHTIGKTTHLGSVRELFAISSLEDAGYTVQYSQTGDIITNGFALEIGGVRKSKSQVKATKNAFVLKDDVLFPSANIRPLYLLGFLS